MNEDTPDTTKYYYPEHLEGYARLKAEGKTAWAELHGHVGFDNFSSRAFWLTVARCSNTPNRRIL